MLFARIERAAVAIVACLLCAAGARAAGTPPDRQAPIVVVEPTAPTPPGDVLLLSARITDPSGVASATAWVKGGGDLAYRAVVMTPAGDHFVSELEPAPSRGDRVTYYVEATDRHGNGPRRSGSPRSPFVAVIAAAPAPAEPAEQSSSGSLRWPLGLAPVAGFAGWWGMRPRRRPRRSAVPVPEIAEEAGMPRIPRASLEALWNPKAAGAAAVESERRVVKEEVFWLSAAGTSLVEMLVVLAVMVTVLGLGAVSFDAVEAPVRRGADLLLGELRQARALAMSTTTAHRVRPTTASQLVVERAPSCAAISWTPEPRLDVDLPDQVTLTQQDWQVCFDTRGLASTNLVATLDHPRYASRSIEVLLGGASRIVQ